MVAHNTLTDPELHEPKGASTAASGSVYISNGAGSGAWTSISSYKPTLGTAVATTSGPGFDFTGIPSTAVKVTISFGGTSLTGSDDQMIQLGTSGGIVSAGYVSSSGTIDFGGAVAGHTRSDGFNVFSSGGSEALAGHMILTRINSGTNEWVSSHYVLRTAAAVATGGGRIILPGALDRIRLTRSGSNSFDGGSVNIMWE